jgi:hypothetical protein
VDSSPILTRTFDCSGYCSWSNRQSYGDSTGLLQAKHNGCVALESLSKDDNSTLSLKGLSMAWAWLQECSTQHYRTSRKCEGAVRAKKLPRHVIDISRPDRPVLVRTYNRQKGTYACLSYKWGNAVKYVTTTSNYGGHINYHIRPDRLPRTWRDAIAVAHLLGFEYLWIDALCIIQDKPDDLEAEIAGMCEIYEHAGLTILAAAGDNADAGLGSSRDPCDVRPVPFQMVKVATKPSGGDGNNNNGDGGAATEMRSNSKTTVRFIMEDVSSVTCAARHATENPLFRRGWVLQEQVLSRRILDFGCRQISWLCPSCCRSETNPTAMELGDDRRTSSLPGIRAIFQGRKGGGKKKKQKAKDEDKKDVPQNGMYSNHASLEAMFAYIAATTGGRFGSDIRPQEEDTLLEWNRLISEYSHRELTCSRDVLPAIAGVAAAFARLVKLPPESYLAGLWREGLYVGLQWEVNRYVPGESEPTDTTRPLPPPPECNIPSWSWASRWGHNIVFTPGTDKDYKVRAFDTVQFLFPGDEDYPEPIEPDGCRQETTAATSSETNAVAISKKSGEKQDAATELAFVKVTQRRLTVRGHVSRYLVDADDKRWASTSAGFRWAMSVHWPPKTLPPQKRKNDDGDDSGDESSTSSSSTSSKPPSYVGYIAWDSDPAKLDVAALDIHCLHFLSDFSNTGLALVRVTDAGVESRCGTETFRRVGIIHFETKWRPVDDSRRVIHLI